MRIDDNKEALAMMNRALGSLEAKIREAYNKGYRDGVKSMVAEDEPQKIYCPKCGSPDYIKDLEKDFGVKDETFKYKCINCNTYIKDEPQTERNER